MSVFWSKNCFSFCHKFPAIVCRVVLNNNSLCYSQAAVSRPQQITVLNKVYETDSWTNVTNRVLSKVGKNLHNIEGHPLNLIRRRIENHFYVMHRNSRGMPRFDVVDSLSPVVTLYQNFDSLLTPPDHPSRLPTDTYYLNKDYLLRAHTTAHEEELMKAGNNAILVVGDVYRRDEVDSTHYPVFHQMEGIRLFTGKELFSCAVDSSGLEIFEDGKRLQDKQAVHTYDAVRLAEYDLKQTLESLAVKLFGKDVVYRWVNCYFPFTHPSWELEVFHNGTWMEMLGCGILEQQIISNAGVKDRMGWAFGLGLERLAMKLYEIPDIRIFWIKDERFLSQFRVDNVDTPIKFKPISKYNSCINNISFWIRDGYKPNDFFDVVRTVGGDLVESVKLIDEFVHPETGRSSHCYRVIYRHMEKTFTKAEVNVIHESIQQAARDQLGVEVRA